MLERATLNALGEGSLEFNADGLRWTCIIRPEHLVDGADAEAPGDDTAARRADEAAKWRASG